MLFMEDSYIERGCKYSLQFNEADCPLHSACLRIGLQTSKHNSALSNRSSSCSSAICKPSRSLKCANCDARQFIRSHSFLVIVPKMNSFLSHSGWFLPPWFGNFTSLGSGLVSPLIGRSASLTDHGEVSFRVDYFQDSRLHIQDILPGPDFVAATKIEPREFGIVSTRALKSLIALENRRLVWVETLSPKKSVTEYMIQAKQLLHECKGQPEAAILYATLRLEAVIKDASLRIEASIDDSRGR